VAKLPRACSFLGVATIEYGRCATIGCAIAAQNVKFLDALTIRIHHGQTCLSSLRGWQAKTWAGGAGRDYLEGVHDDIERPQPSSRLFSKQRSTIAHSCSCNRIAVFCVCSGLERTLEAPAFRGRCPGARFDCGDHDLKWRADKPQEYLRFKNSGFSDRIIRALLLGGIDAPERLLSMASDQIRLIPGVGAGLMKEVEQYRAQSNKRSARVI
jgi:hypothetical protein